MAKLLHTNACLFKVYGKADKCVADVKPRSTFLIWPVGLLIACSQGAMAQSQASVFTVNTNLQSIAVQVTDKKGMPCMA
jgi:hypothetical protein